MLPTDPGTHIPHHGRHAHLPGRTVRRHPAHGQLPGAPPAAAAQPPAPAWDVLPQRRGLPRGCPMLR
eukprot:scaffold291534_cov40-Prasinocladus_malaysianus.AAC.1